MQYIIFKKELGNSDTKFWMMAILCSRAKKVALREKPCN